MTNKSQKPNSRLDLKIHSLTPGRWKDFEKLFGANGACGGCWCMTWRLMKKQFDTGKGNGNKRAMKKLVDSEVITGLLAYHKNQPVAWCSVAPREQFPRLEKAPTLKRIDDEPVWSVTCFYILKEYRKLGVSEQLLNAAISYVKKKGGTVVEGYPYTVKKDAVPLPGAFVWTGLVPAFKKIGFKIAAERSKSRPIMRYHIK